MDGILEKILYELKEIKQLLVEMKGSSVNNSNGNISNETMNTKKSAEYLGITVYRLRTLTKQKEIKHFMAGNRFLYRKSALDDWIKTAQEESVQSDDSDM